MKKMIAILLCTLLLCTAAAALADGEVDAFTSASVTDYYGDYMPEDIVAAVTERKGGFLVGTVNPDGSPNVAYFMFGLAEVDGVKYVRLGLADNQSKANLERTGQGVAVFVGEADEAATGKPYTMAGARMRFTVETDEEARAKLIAATGARETTIFGMVTEVRPLG